MDEGANNRFVPTGGTANGMLLKLSTPAVDEPMYVAFGDGAVTVGASICRCWTGAGEATTTPEIANAKRERVVFMFADCCCDRAHDKRIVKGRSRA